jgi:hypothetical protein
MAQSTRGFALLAIGFETVVDAALKPKSSARCQLPVTMDAVELKWKAHPVRSPCRNGLTQRGEARNIHQTFGRERFGI